MAKNAEEHDILAEILSGVQEDVVEGLDSLYEIIRLEGADASEYQENKGEKPLPKTGRKRPKKKTSHYLTEAVFDELGDAKLDLREFLPDLPKSNVTKSSIVNIAVKTILDEYKEKGLRSTLIQKLLSQRKKR
jgi:hypothetical protein